MRNCRNSKKCRMGIIITLMIVVVILWFVWEKARIAWTLALIMLAIALGIEGYDYDIDLGKYWETKSYSESRVESVKDADGNSYRIITGTCNTKEFDLNCDDFPTQEAAQIKYQECADLVASENPGIDTRKLDIYGLDRDNDGKVCEVLPVGNLAQ